MKNKGKVMWNGEECDLSDFIDEYGRVTPFGLAVDFPGNAPDACIECGGSGYYMELFGCSYNPRLEPMDCPRCEGEGQDPEFWPKEKENAILPTETK